MRCHAMPTRLCLGPLATLKHKRKLIFPPLCYVGLQSAFYVRRAQRTKVTEIFSVLYIGINYVCVWLHTPWHCVCVCVHNWVLLRLCVVCIVLTLLLELICSSSSSLWGLLGFPATGYGFGAQAVMGAPLQLLCSTVI